MRALVLVADSTPARLCHDAAARIAATSADVVVRDLDAEAFAVAMTPAERAAYHGDQPILDPLVADHARDLKSTEVLVFAYATMFSQMPAVMKGWLDRVLVPGVGFVFDDEHKVRPGLTHVRRIVGISTYDDRRPHVKAVHDNGRRTIMRAVRMSAGWRTGAAWIPLYRAPTATADQREAFLSRCVRRAGV
jgi:putative NADPH-quinone reductase